MRALRVLLATLLAAAPVQAQPVVELLTRYAIPADETAASAPEGDAPQGSGKKLAELEADLALVSEGLEAFAHPEDAAKALLAAKPRLPAGTARFFRDRATALDSLYRTLAVVDYTWALRFPDPPCSPAEKRGELLRSDDGLFVDRASGQTSAWMTALLGPSAKGKALEAALDRASASEAPSQAEYARLRARQNLITKALGSDGAVGAARAGLYCKRAETRVRLAAANRTSEQVLAARSSEAKASRRGVVIIAGKTSEGLEARGAGVVVDTKSGVRILTDRRLGNGEVVALVDGRTTPVPLTVEREDVPSGLLLLRPAGDAGEALPLAETAPEKDDLVFAHAHSERLGAWTKTQGLVTSVGSNQFQTDAIVDASMTGGAVLDEEGRLVGLLVLRPTATGEWPAAVPAPALNSWIEGGRAPEAQPGPSLDAGTAKILTASRPLLDSLSVGEGAIVARAADIYTPTPWGTVRGVCMANCEDSAPSTSYSGGSNGNRELGEALGKLAAVGLEALIFKGIPALFRGIGSMFKSKPSVTAPTLRRETVQTRPREFEKPKEPPKLTGLTLAIMPDEGLEGETLTATAELSFSGDEPKKDGINIVFTDNAKGKIIYPNNQPTYSAPTDASGKVTITFELSAKEHDLERPFDELKDEERRRAAEETPSRVRPDRKPKTAFDKVKLRAPDAFDSLDTEEQEAQAGESAVSQADVSEAEANTNNVLTTAAMLVGPTPTPHIMPLVDVPVTLSPIATFTMTASGSSGAMGSAKGDGEVKVVSGECPPGTVAADPSDAGQPGHPPMGSPHKAMLEEKCLPFEKEAEKACGKNRVCRDAKLLTLGYDFRACVDRWKMDGSGVAGNIGIPPLPKPNKRLRCVRKINSGGQAKTRGLTLYAQPGSTGDHDAKAAQLVERILNILKPNGQWIGTRDGRVVRLQGTIEDAKNLFAQLTRGLRTGPHPNPKIGIKGGFAEQGEVSIGFRPSSHSGLPTVDVKLPGRGMIEVKFAP